MKKAVQALLILSASSLTFGAFANAKFQLSDDTISSVHAAMRSGKLSCVQLIKAYLDRIKTYDLSLARGAPIHAFVALNPEVLSQARQLDRYYKKHHHFVGPLHCIPVVVKDNINTVDTPSTSGSLSLLGSQPNRDAFLVQKIRSAGGLIIGKGAMDEFASGMSGISSKSGRVGNALDPNLNPGGSSAGVGAAVAANFAMVGIGTDNSGSVRIPAAFNGVYGLRPSTGLISQNGIFPRGNLDGVAGVIARDIPDLATTLSVIASSADPSDPKTQGIKREKSYNEHLKASALKGARIGVITSVNGKLTMSDHYPQAMAIFKQTFQHLKQFGATVVKVKLPQFDRNREHNMAGEVQDVNHYLASFPSTRKNYRDICLSDRTQTFGGIKGCLEHIKDTAPKNGKTYQQVLAMFAKNRAYVQSIMKQHHLNALLMPLNEKGWSNYDISHVNTWHLAVSSNSGLPAITLIGGYLKDSPHMPVGLELIGKMYGEGELIALTYAYEQHMPKPKQPIMGYPQQPTVLSKLTIPQINNLLTLIGYRAYQKYLKHSEDQMISAKDFEKLVRHILKSKDGEVVKMQF